MQVVTVLTLGMLGRSVKPDSGGFDSHPSPFRDYQPL